MSKRDRAMKNKYADLAHSAVGGVVDRGGNETASCRSGGDRRGAGGWGRARGKNGA
jgi:hypothetical protein